jgi:Tol biopolymer transport system component
VWSPDSDKLLFTEPTVFEDARTYVLNVSTGELTELSQAQGDAFCSGEWLADSERIWSGRTAILNLDGTVAQELPALEESLETENWLDAGISADGGKACFEEAQGDGWGRFCDVYVDTATGQELTLPVDGENRQVTFLYDGTMLILSHADGVATQSLVDAEGNVVDQRDLPGDFAGEVEELVTYYPW